MCLGIPGEVVETYTEHDMLMGKVDFGGIFKRVCLQHTPEAQVGQYVIVHVGFSLQVIDEAEARQVFSFLEHMNELQDLQQEEVLASSEDLEADKEIAHFTRGNDEVSGRIPRSSSG